LKFGTSLIQNGRGDLLQYVAERVSTQDMCLSNCQPQSLSNLAWGTARIVSYRLPTHDKMKRTRRRLSVAPQESLLSTKEIEAATLIVQEIAEEVIKRQQNGHMHNFKTQHLSNIAWALGKMSQECMSTQSENNKKIQEFTKLINDTLDIIIVTSIPRLSEFKSLELNNLTWVIAKLVKKGNNAVDQLLNGIRAQFSNQNRRVTLKDASATLWCFASISYFDDDLYRMICSRISFDDGTKHNQQCSDMPKLIRALAISDIKLQDKTLFDSTLFTKKSIHAKNHLPTDPILRLFDLAATELIRRPYDFSVREIKDILWSFSKLGIRHPSLFKAVAIHLVGNVNGNTIIKPSCPPTIMTATFDEDTVAYGAPTMEKSRGFREFNSEELAILAW
jgi:hypothetical protein